MRKLLVAAALFASLNAASATAATVLQPVDSADLTHFVGSEALGRGGIRLGVVDQVDPRLGLVALTDRHGDFAVIHKSLLMKEGKRIFAPTLTIADISRISMDRTEWPDAVAVAKKSVATVIREEPANSVKLLPERTTGRIARLS